MKTHAKEFEVHQNSLKSFAIGLEGSPDLIAAKKVADMLGTEHHGFTFTVQDGVDAIPDVVSFFGPLPSPHSYLQLYL